METLHQAGLTDWAVLWSGLFFPLLRLLFFMAVGLLLGTLIETFHWTRGVARFTTPLVRMAHFRDVAGAAFAVAFFSGITANAMLANGYQSGELSRRELVLANLFNSAPSFFLHLPSLFFVAVPFLGRAAFVYVGLVLAAAVLRTVGTVLLGRLLLPEPEQGCVDCHLTDERTSWRGAVRETLRRFQKRLPRMVGITIPVYAAMFVLSRVGGFRAMGRFMQEHVSLLDFLAPEGLTIVALHLAAEVSASLAAAGQALHTGTLAERQVVLALLVGNVLSSPMRAFRHQFPTYAGIFQTRMAALLIVVNQTARAGSIVCMAVCYYWISA